MSPSLKTTSLFFLAFLVALAFVGPCGAVSIWVAFFCVCFVPRKTQPAVEGRGNETTRAGDRKRKWQREDAPKVGQVLLRLTQAIELYEKIHVLYIVLCQVVLGNFFRYNIVPLLPPSPARARVTNGPYQPARKRTRMEEDEREAEDTQAGWQPIALFQDVKVEQQTL
jgi:hypothetical protein